MELALASFGVTALFGSSAFALESIPGSVTSGGQRYTETYMIQPDSSLVIT